MKRGDIWWADLPEPYGSMVGYRRPVLIIQANAFNLSRLSTVIVAVLTSTLQLASQPGNVLLRAHKTGLAKDSVVNVTQIISVDRAVLDDFVTTLKRHDMDKVDEGLRLVLDL